MSKQQLREELQKESHDMMKITWQLDQLIWELDESFAITMLFLQCPATFYTCIVSSFSWGRLRKKYAPIESDQT